MKCMIINYEFPPLGGGAGNATFYLAKYLGRLGVNVLVLTSNFKGLPGAEEIYDFSVVRIPVLRRKMYQASVVEMLTFTLSGLWYAPRIAKKFRPQVVYAFFGIPSGPIALWLKILYGIPYIVSIRGGDVPGFLMDELRFYHTITGPLIRLIWKKASYIVANGKRLKELASQFMKSPKIINIPNGVDGTIFYSGSRAREDKGPIKILAVGRLVRQKGFNFLIQAVSQLIKNGWAGQFMVEIVGDGPERTMLERQVASLGLDRIVQFSGWVPQKQLADKYRLFDVFVQPSLDDGISNTFLEAMASGLPVIASDISGNRGLVKHGENGLLIPAGDIEGLARGIESFLRKRTLVETMGKNSVLITKKYTWKNVAKEYLSLATHP